MGGRLLIAAGEAASDPGRLPFGIRALLDAAGEILVVAPALPSRFEWLASATDRAREEADERLGTVLGHLAELGAVARGTVGSDDPLVAIGDAIRSFSPDHLLVALRPAEWAGWQERELFGQLHRFRVPVTVFELPGA